ncbi:MAG TPA: 4Fe-4S binding protein, partial [Pseudobdellovibrionaceae bacterium]|nr:4Fe-4S binding protein [Pseudobdellovibrionaceae bacterium]
PGIFAGGDMVPSERTVTAGIGHGKKAAKNIDAWLKGKNISQPGKNIEAKNDLAPKKELATFENINSWYYSDAPKTVRPHLDNLRRQTTFEEVVGGLDESNALFEARRCLSCGNCFECDNCYGVCPDNAVIKLGAGKGFEINYDYCKGCGICAEECPCGAIAMVLDK